MWIYKEEFEKRKKGALDNAKKEGVEDESSMIFNDLSNKIDHIEFDKKTHELTIDYENEIGWFDVTIEVDDDLAFEIIDALKRKANKIKRLINLTENDDK